MAQVIEIHDFSDPALDVYARATENQLVNRADPANALFIAESPLVIGRALDAGCVPVSFLMEPQHITGKGAEILGRCDPDLPVYTASLEVLTQLTGFHLTRGMLCAMRRPPLPSVAEVCAGARRIAGHQLGKMPVQDRFDLFLVGTHGFPAGVSGRELGGRVQQPAAAKPALMGLFGVVRIGVENRQDPLGRPPGPLHPGLMQ